MPAQIRGVFWDDDDVADALFDRLFTAGTHVDLPSLVRLNRMDDLWAEGHPSSAHPTTTAVMIRNATTTAMSNALLSWSRNGLNPMTWKVAERFE